MRWTCGWRALTKAWDAIQVELHGQYSLTRLRAFYTYSQSSSLVRVVLVIVLTPIPCLIAVGIADSIPLQPPERGIGHTHGYWVRGIFTSFIYSYSAIDQIQNYVPRLHVSLRERIAASLPASFISNAVAYALSRVIGFPLPFALTLSSVPWSLSFFASVWLLRGKFLRQHPDVLRDFLGYLLVLLCQLSMVVLYPAFYSVFANLSSAGQTKFVLLLPVIKLFEKNLLSRFLRNRDDVKPEVVIFNVEIFNALFVSCCMQCSASLNTNLMIMGIDFLQACVSLRDLSQRLAEANKLGDKMLMPRDKLVKTTLLILEDFPSIVQHPSFHNILRVHDSAAGGVSPTQINSVSFSKWAAAGREPHVQPQMPHGLRSVVPEPTRDSSVLMKAIPAQQDQLHQPSGSTQASSNLNSITLDADPKVTRGESRSKSMAAVLTSRERLLFVQKTLEVLYLTEFLLLIEFTEVVIPIVYCEYDY